MRLGLLAWNETQYVTKFGGVDQLRTAVTQLQTLLKAAS